MPPSDHEPPGPPGPPGPRSILRDRDFFAYLVSRAGNSMAVHMVTVAVGWHVYALTRDPLDLGYVGLAQFAPAFLFFLVAGWASDMVDRRAILTICNLIHVAVMGLLVVAVSGSWGASGGVALIFALLTVHGTARAFFHTATQAILPNLVARPDFPRAVAWASTVNKAAQLLGPAVGGLLIAWTSTGAYYVAAALFALSAIGGAVIRGGRGMRAAEATSLAMVLGGFSYVWRNRIVLGAISIDLAAVLLGSVMGLLPIYASDILQVGPEGLGVMRAMPGVGSLLMGIALARIAEPRHIGRSLFIALTIFSLSITIFSVSEIFWLSLVALIIYGASDMVSVYIRLTLVQIATPDAMRGRVSAINSVSINASNELGDFRAGLTAAFVGALPAVLIGGLATLAVSGLWWRMFPAIRKIDRLSEFENPRAT